MTGILRVDTIQNSNTSNIISQTNATTITIGSTGQTIDIAAGASFSVSDINVNLNSSQVTGTLQTGNGGTGLSSLGTSGQVLTVNSSGTALEYTTISTITNLTTNVTGVLRTANGGTGLSSLGTSGQVLTVNSSGTALEYTTISTITNLTTNVTGVLRTANGGTGLSSLGTSNQILTVNSSGTALEYVSSVNITTATTGTLPTSRGGTNLSTIGTANQILTVNSSGTALEYVSSVNITTATTGTLPTSRGGTGLTLIGSAGQPLLVNSGTTALEYGPLNVSTNVTGTLQTANGGTGLSSIGSVDQVLKVTSTTIGNSWSAGPNLSQSRYEATGWGISQEGAFVVGGTNNGYSAALSSAELLSTGIWSSSFAQPINAGRRYGGGSSANSGILAGGYQVSGTPPTQSVISTVHRFLGGSYSTQTSMPTAMMFGGSSGGDVNSLITFGGWNSSFVPQTTTYYWNGGSWTTKANLPTAVTQNAGFGSTSTAVSVGGFSSAGAILTATNTYVLLFNTWSSSGNLGTGVRQPTATGVNSSAGRLFGGLAGSGPTNFCYEFDGNTWTSIANYPQNYQAMSSAGGTTSSLAFGGTTNNGAGQSSTYFYTNASTVTSLNYGSVPATNLSTNVTGVLRTANGGTGLSSIGTSGQVLAVNSGSTGLEFTGITVDLYSNVTGTLQIGNGGTGLNSFSTGDIICASTTNVLSKLAIGSPNQILKVNSSGQFLEYGALNLSISTNVTNTLQIGNGGTGLSSLGTSDQILTVNSGGTALNYVSSVNITTATTGTLPINRGGTNLTSLGTSGQVLTVNSSGTALEYTTLPSGGLTNSTLYASSTTTVGDYVDIATYKTVRVTGYIVNAAAATQPGIKFTSDTSGTIGGDAGSGFGRWWRSTGSNYSSDQYAPNTQYLYWGMNTDATNITFELTIENPNTSATYIETQTITGNNSLPFQGWKAYYTSASACRYLYLNNSAMTNVVIIGTK